jgi:hypothetical protein
LARPLRFARRASFAPKWPRRQETIGMAIDEGPAIKRRGCGGKKTDRRIHAGLILFSKCFLNHKINSIK